MLRAPQADDIKQLFELAAYQLRMGRAIEASKLLRFIVSVDPDYDLVPEHTNFSSEGSGRMD